MSKAIEQLSKNLAIGMSRRKALWRFTGLGAIGGLGLLTSQKASAQNCFFELEEAYSACLGTGGSGSECLAQAECAYGGCISGHETEICDGKCVDISTDNNNCGGCGFVCGSTCVDGECET